MTDFDSARSGLWAGVIMGGLATVAFGVVAGMGVVDLVRGLAAPTGPSTTSVIVSGVCGLATLVFGLLALSSRRQLVRWRRINDSGIAANATLGDARRTNARINRRNLYRLTLRVEPDRGAPYDVEARWFFPLDLRDTARPGTRVVVRVDPKDRTAVLVDWDATRARWGTPAR